MGTPSIPDLVAILRMNIVKDNPITIEDIKLAERIFGPDVATLKGKTTRRKPLVVVEDMISIPRELVQAQQHVTLAMDAMTVNSLNFLVTISKNLYYRTAHFTAKKSPELYKQAVDSLVVVYNRGGFQIKKILCDNEFRPLMTPLALDHHIEMNFANPQEHVPEAERNVRVGKERVRAAYHRMAFTHLPKILTKYTVREAYKKLNFYPAKHGCSKYYSPRMILHQQNLDYAKHCKYSLGQYVQGHDEPNPTNTNASRTLDCLYLSYHSTTQGGHELLHLATNQVVIRRNVTPIPITPQVIKRVHKIAELDGMPKGLKITNRYGTILFDSTLIEGVDYAADDFDDEDYSDDDESTQLTDEDTLGEEFDEIDPEELDEIQDQVYNDENENVEDVVEIDESDSESDESEAELDENQEVQNNENADNAQEDEDINEAVEADELSDEESDSEANDTNQDTVTRSGRISKAATKLNLFHSEECFYQDASEYDIEEPEGCIIEEYTPQNARVIATVLSHITNKIETHESFAQTFSLKKGIKVFGEKGEEAAYKEMKQLHDRVVFEPIKIHEMTPIERKRAMESLIFLVEKRDGTIKARTCANGSTQREYIEREAAASPTASTDSIIITSIIDAKQERDVMTSDVPNAFVQTDIPHTDEMVVMKIRGVLVDMLVDMCPEVYADHVVMHGKDKILYVRMLKALYGMLVASLLYYKKFVKDIESIGFVLNPYDPCLANRMVDGKQHTIAWHVDDIKSSHLFKKVNDEFLKWLEKTYGEDGIGTVKTTRGLKHDYLAMVLDFSVKGKLRLDMTEYIINMVKDWEKLLGVTLGENKAPWSANLFKVDEKSPPLKTQRREIFHTFVMKGMFVCKRARQDVQPGIVFLSSRTSKPNEGDWKKLVRLMTFLKTTRYDVATLEADDSQSLNWYVDAAFAVHGDFKSHTGMTMTLGKGCATSHCGKQKVNTRSSTESEMVGIDDVVTKIIWTKLMIEAQGFKIKNIAHRDNTSSMKLEANGKSSSGKRTRHFNIKYFYVTDLVKRGEVILEYCPTDNMTGDYMTKPLVGAKFTFFRNQIMNFQ
jgi:hypothetical protein